MLDVKFNVSMSQFGWLQINTRRYWATTCCDCWRNQWSIFSTVHRPSDWSYRSIQHPPSLRTRRTQVINVLISSHLVLISSHEYQLTPTDPRDAASRPIDYRAVHRAGRRVRSTAGDRRRLYMLTALSTSDVVARRCQQETDCIRLDGWIATVKFSKFVLPLGRSFRGKYPYFRRYFNILKNTTERRRYAKNPAQFVQPFRHNTSVWQTHTQTARVM